MKKQRDNLELIRHMLEFSEEALGYADEMSIDSFQKDLKLKELLCAVFKQ